MSDSLFVIKAFAVLSVVTAHMMFTDAFPVSESMRNAFGQIGVPVFLIISGFFFRREKGDSKTFWLKKIKTIALPWIVCAVGTFALSFIISHGRKNLLLDGIKWVFGINSWYWYLPVLFVLFALFKFIKRDILLYVCMSLTVFSVIISALGLFPYGTLINLYRNVFNWIGFFAFGILLRKYGILEKFIKLPILVISVAVLVCSIFLTSFLTNHISYINYCSLLVEISGFFAFLNISYYLSNVKLLQDIGRKSYLIYLVHAQIADVLNTRLPYNFVFFILRPILALMIVYLLICLLELFLKKTGLIKYGYILALGKKI